MVKGAEHLPWSSVAHVGIYTLAGTCEILGLSLCAILGFCDANCAMSIAGHQANALIAYPLSLRCGGWAATVSVRFFPPPIPPSAALPHVLNPNPVILTLTGSR